MLAEEKEIVITKKTQVEKKADDIVLDDYVGIKICTLYFFYTISVIAVILFFLILELGISQLSGVIEQIPGIYPLISQAIFDKAQTEVLARNLGDLCANCLVSTFCSCLGNYGAPEITLP